ncbi:polysaccharide deacetylase family protein [Carboxylicivirga marina]|uniref:polysaccharide deacetylase family protein n=1 Tax=Carboxylicivirga marina TaxID=2800988 RepID=UPI00259930E6|nr:polysaccharide deacetylase family protein [uncultured Carboxylicivirga sp.]
MVRFSFILALFLLFLGNLLQAQKYVAITVDDVPKVGKYQQDGCLKLLDTISSLGVPVAAFINEGLVVNHPSGKIGERVLERWISHEKVTVGMHTFAHSRYSEIGVDSFANDIIKGMALSKALCSQHSKALKYFRFPYNDLGKDSVQHLAAQLLLDSLQLISTPFTIESSDWMFNTIYEYYIDTDSIHKASEIGEAYVQATMRNFHWMDSLMFAQYDRAIKHIYLCHDNSINVDYLPVIIKKLREQDYKFVSLDTAMKDKVYTQTSYFYKKWGISWVYRWMEDSKQRIALMRQEPDVMAYMKLYDRISSQKKY